MEEKFCDVTEVVEKINTPEAKAQRAQSTDETEWSSDELFDDHPFQSQSFEIPEEIDISPNAYYCGMPCMEFDSTCGLFDANYLSPGVFDIPKQIIALKAPMGTGKTTALFTYLGDKNVEMGGKLRYLIICPTKSLITSICEKYGCSNYSHFSGYIQECLNLVITPNSLWRCQSIIANYDVIILDEVEGSMRSLVSSIMSVKQLQSFVTCINIYYNEMKKNNSKKIILMDALLKDESIDFFIKERDIALSNGLQNYIILNAYPEETETFKLRKRILYFKKFNDMVRELLIATRSGDPVIASFSDKELMESLARLINAPSFDFLTRIGIMQPDNYGQIKVITCSTSTSKDASDERSINAFVADPDGFLEKNKILFHTSVVQSGVSVKIPARVFVFAKSFLMSDTIVQMMGRVRNPIGRVNLNIDQGDSGLKFIKKEEIEETFLNYINGTKSERSAFVFDNVMSTLMGYKKFTTKPLISAMDDPRIARLFSNQVMGQFRMRAEPFDELQRCLTMDAKCWDWQTYGKPCTPVGGPLTTKDLITMAQNNDKYDGKFRKILNQRGICVNRDHVEQCVKNYGLLGLKDFDNFQVYPDILTRGFDFIKQDELELFTVTFGFGSFILAELVRYSPNASEIRSCSSFHAIYLAVFDLIYILTCGTGEGYAYNVVKDTPHIFITSPRKLCDKLEISPKSIITNFWAIAAWFETHKPALLSRGRCVQIGEYIKDFNTNPTKTIKVIISDIVKFLESLGLKFEDHGIRRQNKRLQTSSIKTIITDSTNKSKSELYHFIDGISLRLDEVSALDTQIPKHCWKINHSHFNIYFDISIRHYCKIIADFNGYSHPKYPTLHLDIAENKKKIDDLMEIAQLLKTGVSGYVFSPSFWLHPKKNDRDSFERKMSDSVIISWTNVKRKRMFSDEQKLSDYLGNYDADKIKNNDEKFSKWKFIGKRTLEESQKTDISNIESLSDEEIWNEVIMMETDRNEYIAEGDEDFLEELYTQPSDPLPKRRKTFE